MRRLTHHIKHYLPLIGIFGATLVGFVIFSYDTNFRIVLLIASACGYVSWGIVHHYLHGDLHTSVIVEYSVIAILGLTIVSLLLLRV